ncbi:sodium-dependent glucose transporter 1B-like [Argopecten irradians]|uniref:sodium-dependent glucose transporter 1B-like n=1 Tax=Argopecten irradians TaxID=31199 RepID=UPI0037240027
MPSTLDIGKITNQPGYILLQGLLCTQTNAALLELQRITSVSLEQAALYVSTSGFGMMLGCMLCGAVYNYIDKFLAQFVTMVITAVVLVIIPWCTNYFVMATAQGTLGTLLGFLDTVVMAEVLAVWGTEGRSFVQAVNLGFAIGGVIAPIMVAQFVPKSDKDALEEHKTNENYSAIETNISLFSEIVDWNVENIENHHRSLDFTIKRQSTDSASHIYIAYVISASICVTIGMLFFVMFLFFSRNIYADRSKPEAKHSTGGSRCWKVAILANIGIMYAVYISLADTLGSFVIAFCVKQLHWTMQKSSLLLSLADGCFCVGLTLSIFWVRYVRPKVILGIFCPLISIMFFVMTCSGFTHADYGMWISSAVLGFLMSVILPTIFSWTEEEYFPVTGKIASVFNVLASICVTVTPVITGVLMDRYSPMCFTYILLIMTWVLMVLYMAAVMLAPRTNSQSFEYSKLATNGDIEMEIFSEHNS